MRTQDQIALRIYVRTRQDSQSLRKAMGNRLGITAKGKPQKLKEARYYGEEDIKNFFSIYKYAKHMEGETEKMLKEILKRFPIWNEWLSKVDAIAHSSGGYILGEFDIYEATTVSKMWQYAGLNPGLVRGMKRVKVKDYKESMGEIKTKILDEKGKVKEYIILTNTLVKGDRPTPGFVLPYNKNLRTFLIGILAENFIKFTRLGSSCKKLKGEHAPDCSCERSPYYLNFYLPYKARLKQEASPVKSMGTKDDGKPWQEVSANHHHFAAKRYMIKMFLLDLYIQWRTIENLPVRKPYAEEYLDKVHNE